MISDPESTPSTHPVRDAMLARRSGSSAGDAAPSHDELAELVRAASRVADHSSLRPWRLIELRGGARERLGAALAEAAGDDSPSTKPLRSPLLLAVVFSPRPSFKVPAWEQEAVASGVAHAMTLLLDEAGWAVLWRTGIHTRSEPVANMHDLAPGEQLLGWLYIGARKDKPGKIKSKKSVDPNTVLSVLA